MDFFRPFSCVYIYVDIWLRIPCFVHLIERCHFENCFLNIMFSVNANFDDSFNANFNTKFIQWNISAFYVIGHDHFSTESDLFNILRQYVSTWYVLTWYVVDWLIDSSGISPDWIQLDAEEDLVLWCSVRNTCTRFTDAGDPSGLSRTSSGL